MPTDSVRGQSSSDAPHALLLVFSSLSQKDRCNACVVCKEWNAIGRRPSLWKVLDLQGMRNGGSRLASALLQPRFQQLEELNLEFTQGLEDEHLALFAGKLLRRLNLNACQKVTDKGVTTLTSNNPNLTSISLYWNLKITDSALENLPRHCPMLVRLNVSGCKKISDAGVVAVAKGCKGLVQLNITRCPKVTDGGVVEVVKRCGNLEELYLYADSSLTDVLFSEMGALKQLRLLDLCGMQHLTDAGLSAIAGCQQLRSLNLTWCVQVTDKGLTCIGRECCSLEWLSVHGIRGITDASLTALASGGSRRTLSTLDVNGCIGIKRRSREDLLALFPRLVCFQVHS